MPEEVYTTPGVWHMFVVPAGVTGLWLDIKGAGSGGVAGGHVAGAVAVTPGDRLFVVVGEKGHFHSNRQPGERAWGGGGAGGRGRGTGNGGDGGGGASWVSWGSPSSYILGLAGGAGGNSGDGADGGSGGAGTGESGRKGPGNDGGRVATGGTQSSPGRGGGNPNAGPSYDGGDADDAVVGWGGRGGSVGDGNSHGGGGGGGGWYSGGGGNASGGNRPAGSGGGGSNFAGRLEGTWASQWYWVGGGPVNERGGGSTTNGSVTIKWVNPPPPHLPPPPPSDLKVNGVDLGTDTTTQAMTEVTFTANLSNPDTRESAQMVVRLVPADADPTTQEWNFDRYWQVTSQWVGSVGDGGDAIPVSAVASGLTPNTKYYVRAYTLDSTGTWSQYTGDDPTVTDGGWVGGSFWTNRPPDKPQLQTPSENSSFEADDSIFFSWSPMDADDNDSQTAWEVRTRRLTRPSETISTDWVSLASQENNATSYTVPAVNFTGNQFYMWSVRTRDNAGVWSEWSVSRSFFVEASTIPPVPVSPVRDAAVIASQTSVFRWQYLDPISGSTQLRADIRYRVVGTEDWVTSYGDGAVPGGMPEWLFPLETFIEGYHYEWAVRTTNSAGFTSDWSNAERFWATAAVGQGLVTTPVLPNHEVAQPPLGCGVNRVFIFDRGGQVLRGEITGISLLRYGRKRDDISNCDIIVNDFSKDCGALLSDLRTWQHEIVIFRDGKRVWEGPVTRITSSPTQFSIEAKDPMVYLYRRIMRQGFNDTYRKVNGVEYTGVSVVHRAMTIAMNALAYDDPNVLPWLTEVSTPGAARQMRAVPDYAKYAWEEIDDLAATAGLDYTTVGRRIIFWDTHRAIGKLPEMRDEHFSEPVHITEYGMQLANYYAVTNNNGVWGAAYRALNPTMMDLQATSEDGTRLYDVYDHLGRPIPPYYGWIEQLVSAYGESEGEQQSDLTEEGQIELEETLRKQALRGIASRWPAPVVVRVPDNAQIQPTVNIGFDQLVPGVWIPVRATGTLRQISQWQKLDTVTVEQTSAGEKITVTMSPAPNGGQDPDADVAETEA